MPRWWCAAVTTTRRISRIEFGKSVVPAAGADQVVPDLLELGSVAAADRILERNQIGVVLDGSLPCDGHLGVDLGQVSERAGQLPDRSGWLGRTSRRCCRRPG